MPRPPRLSDPASTPRFAIRGAARRDIPIWTREQFGPWKCDVRVTPITGLRRHPIFEVNVQWEKGPPLDTSLGPTPPTGMQASDVYVVDPAARDMQLRQAQAAELAIRLAQVAADLLAEGVKPDLYALARELRKRLK